MKILIVTLCIIPLVLLSLASTAGFFGHVAQICELCSHLRVVYFVGFAVFLPILLICRYFKAFALFALFAVANAVPVVDLYLPSAQPQSDGETLSVLQFNLWGGRNRNYQAVVDTINHYSPDVVGFSEVTASWEQKLTQALPQYKYKTFETRFGGIGILSKLPIKRSEILYYGPKQRPRIEAQLQSKSTPVGLFMIHPMVPKDRYAERNGELALVAERAGACKAPLILIGDLNCSSWSAYFEDLQRVAHLKDTQKGFGFMPTWLTFLRVPFLAIDHCLVTEDIAVQKRYVGPNMGSDHLPVYVELKLPRKDGGFAKIGTLSQ